MKKIILLLILPFSQLFAQVDKNIYGEFLVNQVNFVDSNAAIQVNNSVAAYFSQNATSNIDLFNLDSVGLLNFNSIELVYDFESKFYSGLNLEDVTSKHWEISGFGGIPPMNFIYSFGLPVFNVNLNLISDTIFVSDTLFINLPGLQQCDSIHVFISDDSQLLINQHTISVHSPNFEGSFYITPTVLSTLTLGPRSTIIIEAINYNYQTVSGKQFLFKNSYSYAKPKIILSN